MVFTVDTLFRAIAVGRTQIFDSPYNFLDERELLHHNRVREIFTLRHEQVLDVQIRSCHLLGNDGWVPYVHACGHDQHCRV